MVFQCITCKNKNIEFDSIDICLSKGSCVLYCIWIVMWMDLCCCTWVRNISSSSYWMFLSVSIPIAIDIIFRRRDLFNFIKWSVISGLIIIVSEKNNRRKKCLIIFLEDSIDIGWFILLWTIGYSSIESHSL